MPAIIPHAHARHAFPAVVVADGDARKKQTQPERRRPADYAAPRRAMIESVSSFIIPVRGERVILAADLAALYGVPPRRLNEQVRRNAARFPEDFAFALSKIEFARLRRAGVVGTDGRTALRSQNAILKRGQHAKYPPLAFTEHGAIMAANVLNSPEAIAMGVYVVRAFVQLRRKLATDAEVLKRLAEIDRTLIGQDEALKILWRKLQPLLAPPPEPPRRRIGFHAGDQGA